MLRILTVSAAAVAAAGTHTPRTAAPSSQHIQPNGEPKIKHMVVMLMENRATDHIFGCMAGEGIIGLDGINGSRIIPKDPNNASAGHVEVTCGTADYVCEHGAPYSPYLNKFPDLAEYQKNFPRSNRSWTPQNFSNYPYGPQDDKFSYHNGARETAIQMFNSTQLPVKAAIAKEFAVFNALHSSVPSYSTPNHLFWGFGSSCGLSTNPRCNASGYEPPAHIFDSLHAANVSYRSYSNDSAASPPTGGNSSGGSACPFDLMFNASRRHKDHCVSMDQFYKDAAAGTLPSFSYLTPPFEASDHPCNDVAKGERLVKDLYEGLRAGPGWENTLFFVAYDDPGGFYDHILPPIEDVPNPGNDDMCPPSPPCSPDWQPPDHFDFRRLGLRVASYLISPWIPRNTAIQHPSATTAGKKGSRYDLTSGIATAKEIFNLPTYLTKRDAWSGTFGPLLTLDKPRTDCPMHFPDAPPATSPWLCPGCHNEESELRRMQEAQQASKSGSESQPQAQPQPQHCSAQRQVCQGTASITEKQRNQIRSLSEHFPESAPADFDALDFQAAAHWIKEHEHRWLNEISQLPKLDTAEFMRRTSPSRH